MKNALSLCAAIFLVMLLDLPTNSISAAQPNSARPFSLPFNEASGSATWMFEQFFGNTTEAYNFGKYWYAAGQGLHFGMDFEARCGTTVVAIADGVVDKIDNPTFGALPHTIVIKHEALGYVSVYGHLRDRPTLLPGTPVRRGDPIAVTGDPDYNCESRPHLHLEIRSLDYRVAYNPAMLINADWDMLYSLHQPEATAFAKELRRPNRWQRITDQPEVQFNGDAINRFAETFPPAYRFQAPALTLPVAKAPVINVDAPLAMRRLTMPGCCTQPFWSVDSKSVLYLDADAERDTSIVRSITASGTATIVEDAPPALTSPNGEYEVRRIGNTTTLIHLLDGKRFPLITRGANPQFSPNSSKLLWHVRPADDIPGEIAPRTEIWVADVPTGDANLIRVQSGGSVRWLDDDRILIGESEVRSQRVQLSILTLSNGEINPLIKNDFMRSLSVSPGGRYLLYALILQDAPDRNGLYLLETQPGAVPQKLPFFGGWRWRDSTSLLYIPFGEAQMSLVEFNIETGAQHPLSLPKFQTISIAVADWEISPDGRHIVYVDARDGAIWLLTLPLREFF
ncbi:MAG: M23 family metallopeptidase [Anaerolineae bacterium]